MKRILVVVCAMFLMCGVIATARADTFVPLVNQSSGWRDVEQSPYGNMCWAASASNMLSYTNWNGGTALQSASDIFSYFTSHWQNVNSNPYDAVEWWFNATNPNAGQFGWSQVTTAGGDFYPTSFGYPTWRYSEVQSDVNADLGTWIVDNVNAGLVGTILLGQGPGTGIHWLTYWGYGKDNNGVLDSVWVTDSFDNTNQILDATLSKNISGEWQLSGYQTIGFVMAEGALEPNNPYTAPSNPVNVPTNGAVPEPTTLILLGSGLFGLFLVRKRT